MESSVHMLEMNKILLTEMMLWIELWIVLDVTALNGHYRQFRVISSPTFREKEFKRSKGNVS